MTVAGMLLVNNPGTWDAIYPPLEHAKWHGWTPTDLIFPFFLFIVGITTELSLGRRSAEGATDREIRRQILRRGFLIVLMGLLLAAFPFYPLTRITGIRIPGVLQRIGLCYAIAALIAWRRSTRVVVAVTAVLLLGYWAIITLIPAPGSSQATIDVPDQTIAAYLDRLLLSGHLWSQTKTWDPEGPLSTIPAIGTSLLGILAGRWVRRAEPLEVRLNGLFAAGCIGVVLGLCWNSVFPINKNLWTSSYVVFTASLATLFLGTVSWLVEVNGLRRWTTPLVTYGKNPLVAFLGSGLMARALGSWIRVGAGDGRVSLQEAIYQRAFASWLAPVNASLAFAIAFVIVWYLLLLFLERRGWILKI
jgi:predicted acyltransferase